MGTSRSTCAGSMPVRTSTSRATPPTMCSRRFRRTERRLRSSPPERRGPASSRPALLSASTPVPTVATSGSSPHSAVRPGAWRPTATSRSGIRMAAVWPTWRDSRTSARSSRCRWRVGRRSRSCRHRWPSGRSSGWPTRQTAGGSPSKLPTAKFSPCRHEAVRRRACFAGAVTPGIRQAAVSTSSTSCQAAGRASKRPSSTRRLIR